MRLNKALLVFSLSCAVLSLSAQQQTKPAAPPLNVAPVAVAGIAPVGTSDTLIYEVLETPPAVMGLGMPLPVMQETRIERKPNGHQIYTTANSKHEFDPVTMASTLKTKLSADLDLQVTSRKIGASWPVGSTWRVQHMSPPRIKSLCPRTVALDYTTKVVGTSSHNMMLYGKPYRAEAVNVQLTGRWSTKGCGNGVLQMTASYAPTLQVVLAYAGRIQVGKFDFKTNSQLKEVKSR
jgi:hypothetical protein